jgi:ubiquinone/menaquinone biosynthesis C-methylase UbiE
LDRTDWCHDSQAETYDSQVRKFSGDYIRENYFPILDRVVELIPAGQGLRILDIGIGTGLLTERMPGSLDLYGIDVSPKMMDKARQKGLPVQLKLGSFLDIPYHNAHFDGIVSTFSFHHLTAEEKQDAYAEMNRILKPKAFIIIGDFMFENEAQERQLAKRFLDEGRADMLEEFQEEHFTYIDSASASLQLLGYSVGYERGSTLSWILQAVRH